MNRAEKQQEIERIHQEFLGAGSAYLVEFTGLNVAQVDALRRKARKASAKYRVVKNRLAIRALEGTLLAEQAALFDGPTAVAYTSDDPIALAKVLAEFQKDSSLRIKGLLIDGKPMPVEELDRIVALPTRKEMIAIFARMLKSPIQKFASLLMAPVRDFASVVRQVGEKKES
ncbi:MAG: 50S ribosomal protein L10 [Acidobacteriota bacterium]